MAGETNPLANYNILDTRIGDRVLNLAALTAIMLGNPDQQEAFAEALAAIEAENPAGVIASEFQLDTGTKTATAVAGAATLNKQSGKITSEELTTAAGADYTLTLTNDGIEAADIVMASVQLGTATTGIPQVLDVTVDDGEVVIRVRNVDDTDPFDGDIVISFAVIKAALSA